MSAPGSALRLVLASASPARLATLRAAGVDPYVVVSDVDEDAVVAQAISRYPELAPADKPLLLARAKCEAVATLLDSGGAPAGAPGNALVLGCDSMLELDGQVYGKPLTPQVARQRWQRMSGHSGILYTGHWLIDEREDSTGATLGVLASTMVHFADISPAEIESYVATGEPLAVAGGFTIDGLGGPFIAGLEGDPHNVVGLSLPVLRDLLAQVDVGWFDIVGEARTPPGG